jgi:hypothetical protein
VAPRRTQNALETLDPEAEGGEFLFDAVRRKNLKALPEERVRQALIRWLTEEIGAPARLIAVEYPLSALDPASRKRADVVVWKTAPASHAAGGLHPWLLAECKAPGVRLTDAVADQIRRYAEKIRAEHVLVTNGKDTRCYRLRGSAYKALDGLPAFTERARAET